MDICQKQMGSYQLGSYRAAYNTITVLAVDNLWFFTSNMYYAKFFFAP